MTLEQWTSVARNYYERLKDSTTLLELGFISFAVFRGTFLEFSLPALLFVTLGLINDKLITAATDLNATLAWLFSCWKSVSFLVFPAGIGGF